MRFPKQAEHWRMQIVMGLGQGLIIAAWSNGIVLLAHYAGSPDWAIVITIFGGFLALSTFVCAALLYERLEPWLRRVLRAPKPERA